MPAWAAWVILAAGLAIGEVLTVSFLLGPLAGAAVVAALVAVVGGGVVLQVLMFVIASIASLLLLRPVAMRHLRTPPALRTGTAALVGARAVVTERVTDAGGQVKIGGEMWSARPFFEGESFDAGARVEVAKIDGAAALALE